VKSSYAKALLTWKPAVIVSEMNSKQRKPNEPVSEIMVPVSPALYAKAAQKAEYDGVPVHTLMETALQKFVQHV
jgi:predicted HicB family RNase H-like nuclease